MQKNNQIQENSEWEQLREILTGEERRQIEEILERLDNDEIHASEISRVLPEAMRLSAKYGNRLNEVLLPIIENSLHISIKRDPSVLVEALYGLIGPAARKAVFESIKGLLESFNTALESAFTLKGIKWRIESISSGRPYAEVVLIHSILYRVEQVFLIHKETGLLLQHVNADNIVAQDEDMVSSMLKAIQDFVNDSFELEGGDTLDTLNIGNMTVWTEQSPHAVLAAVIRGKPPESLRKTLVNTLENIHQDYNQNLKEFQGETDVFEPAVGDLVKCLKTQVKSEAKKTPVFAWVGIVIIALLIGVFSYFQISNSLKWSDYINRIKQENGLIILEEDRSMFGYEINGLRDPASVNPEKLLQEYNISRDNVDMKWTHYISTDPEIILRKANNIENKPNELYFTFEKGYLIATGKASEDWLSFAEKTITQIPGAKGFDHKKVISIEDEEIKVLVDKIENSKFIFERSQTKLLKGQIKQIEDLGKAIKELQRISKNKDVIIEIIGHTDSRGSEKTNDLLSWNRAKTFMELLVQEKQIVCDFTLKGIGYKDPLVKEKTEEDMQLNRRVSFKVRLVKNRE